MFTTGDAFDGCRGLYSKSQYAISERQVSLIESAVDWITAEVSKTLDPLYNETKLLLFREAICTFLKSRLKKLGCANLRTIGSRCNLYSIADKYEIPYDALPKNISIIINNEMCYYLKGSLTHRNIIKSY